MPESDDENEPYPCSDIRVFAQHHNTELVERHAKHSARQAKCIKTYVREDIAHNASGHAVSVPQASADVNQRVTPRCIEDEDTQSRDSGNDDKHRLRRFLRKDTGHSQHSRNERAEDERKPAPSGDSGLEAKATREAYSLDSHSQTDVHDTDDESQYHHNIVAGNLARFVAQLLEHACLSLLGEPRSGVKVDAKETAHEVTNHRRAYAQSHDDGTETGEHLNFEFVLIDKPPDEDEHQSVARIAYAESEEQEEEGTKNRSRVKLAIVGPAVHAGEDLEHASEPVVAQFDRCFVLSHRVFSHIIAVELFEARIERIALLDRAEALQEREASFGGRASGEFNTLPVNLLLQLAQFIAQRFLVGVPPCLNACVSGNKQSLLRFHILQQL